MKKKELQEQIGNLKCRMDDQLNLIQFLLVKNDKHEERIGRLNKKFTKISEYFQEENS